MCGSSGVFLALLVDSCEFSKHLNVYVLHFVHIYCNFFTFFYITYNFSQSLAKSFFQHSRRSGTALRGSESIRHVAGESSWQLSRPKNYEISPRGPSLLVFGSWSFLSTAKISNEITKISVTLNIVADTLSRVETLRLPTEFSLVDLAQVPASDGELKRIVKNDNYSLKVRTILWGSNHTLVYCNFTGEALRPYIPSSFRERVFRLFHHLAHPGSRNTDEIIRKRYLWPTMHRDIAKWCKASQAKQLKSLGIISFCLLKLSRWFLVLSTCIGYSLRTSWKWWL